MWDTSFLCSQQICTNQEWPCTVTESQWPFYFQLRRKRFQIMTNSSYIRRNGHWHNIQRRSGSRRKNILTPIKSHVGLKHHIDQNGNAGGTRNKYGPTFMTSVAIALARAILSSASTRIQQTTALIIPALGSFATGTTTSTTICAPPCFSAIPTISAPLVHVSNPRTT